MLYKCLFTFLFISYCYNNNQEVNYKEQFSLKGNWSLIQDEEGAIGFMLSELIFSSDSTGEYRIPSGKKLKFNFKTNDKKLSFYNLKNQETEFFSYETEFNYKIVDDEDIFLLELIGLKYSSHYVFAKDKLE